MFDFEQIKELIGSIDNSGITSFEIKGSDGERLVIKKEIKQEIISAPAPLAEASPAAPAPASPAAQESAAPAEPEENYRIIPSPMVGVFYSAPSPDSEPYVKVGQSVSSGDVVCIIEAMKLMNEVPATESGVIAEICVNNGDIVEYGQPLFKIK